MIHKPPRSPSTKEIPSSWMAEVRLENDAVHWRAMWLSGCSAVIEQVVVSKIRVLQIGRTAIIIQDTSMLTTMQTTTAITMMKPVYSTPHPLAGDKVPLTVFDRAAFDTYVQTVRAYAAPAPSNEALKEGLRRAVAVYPHLAGRLAVDDQGRRSLHINDEGVLIVEATVSGDLADVLADGMAANFHELYTPLPEETVGPAVLQVKINRYKCGGVMIGVIFHHHVADGHSMSMFYTAWGRAVREGKDFTVPSPPFLDRAATAVPRSATPAFNHRSVEFKGRAAAAADDDAHGSKPHVVLPLDKIKTLRAQFTTEFIAGLRARAGAGCTTFQCVLAHVWKKMTATRGLRPEEFTQVRVAVNCRARANPPVPANFFGNMVLWAFPRLQVRDLLGSSYGSVAGAIRDAVARVDSEYIQSFVDFGAAADANGEELAATAATPGTVMLPDLEVDSLLGFRFHEMDFGTGPPCAFATPDMPLDGLMVFVPSCSPPAKGGVDVFVAVAEGHVQAFQQICYSVDCAGSKM
ncbi:hypothetical protein ACP4OV_030671 [Aristida adscensionis]